LREDFSDAGAAPPMMRSQPLLDEGKTFLAAVRTRAVKGMGCGMSSID
jgi:hypothetical protein